jgi:hypothetical protein
MMAFIAICIAGLASIGSIGHGQADALLLHYSLLCNISNQLSSAQSISLPQFSYTKTDGLSSGLFANTSSFCAVADSGIVR